MTAHRRVASGTTSLGTALDDIGRFLSRYVVFSRPDDLVAVTLWVGHTHAIAYADTTGYLAITSPEKGSGKTRLLELLKLVAAECGGILITPTAATIYRTLEASPGSTLLLDELDATFRDRSDRYEEVRAVINAGHRRGATVPRSVVVGKSWTVKHFEVFCPKALSGIGRLPDTIADRSIPIRMLKKKRTEHVERLRMRLATPEAEPLVAALVAALGSNPPHREADIPAALADRAADAWEPLIAIADAAGGTWPLRARRAAVLLHASHDDEESLPLRLLSDIRQVFDRRKVERLATASLIEALRADEESPWASDRGALNPGRLSWFLRPFGIRSKQMKLGGTKVRGFERDSFVDVWERYVSGPVPPRPDAVPRYLDDEESTGVPASTPASLVSTEAFVASDVNPPRHCPSCRGNHPVLTACALSDWSVPPPEPDAPEPLSLWPGWSTDTSLDEEVRSAN